MGENQARVKNADVRHPSCTVVSYRRKSASPVHNVLSLKPDTSYHTDAVTLCICAVLYSCIFSCVRICVSVSHEYSRLITSGIHFTVIANVQH